MDEQVARGKRAELLLSNSMLTEAFDTLETEYLKFWRATNATDTDARERIFVAVNVVGKVRDHLARVAKNGEIADRQLRELAGKKRGLLG